MLKDTCHGLTWLHEHQLPHVHQDIKSFVRIVVNALFLSLDQIFFLIKTTVQSWENLDLLDKCHNVYMGIQW